MLELKNIKKIYEVGEIETKALNDISVSFRKKEFVAILGESGSGKTTCLNIIGGLDRYSSGDLIIKGRSTKDFKEKDWDAYRNNSIGFVFQSYNLITHLSIVANVELGMTLSGVSKEQKHKRALQVLTQVGLKDHLHKKPNQLSGGQMQRVAIARALANNPEILLCDEPTGALDSKTSVSIMNLIKEIAKDRLVIMVTHNAKIAEQYANRIIQFKDGKIIADTDVYEIDKNENKFSLKKTSMNFFTALKISFNNLKTKKGRTFLTSFASSIGIIGIAIILSLSSGFQAQIDNFQQEAMAEFPIIISPTAMSMDKEKMQEYREETGGAWGNTEYVTSDEVYIYDPTEFSFSHNNIITNDYVEYVNNINPEICSSIGYIRLTGMNLIRQTDENTYLPIRLTSKRQTSSMSSDMGISSYPSRLNEQDTPYLEENYDILAGSYPNNETDIVLVVDSKNRVDYTVLENLGFDTGFDSEEENKEAIKFTDLVGTTFKLIVNNDYYSKNELNNLYIPNTDYDVMYNSPNSITITISGIVRQKQDVDYAILKTGMAYSDDLVQRIIDINENSQIVLDQKNLGENVLAFNPFGENFDKEQMIAWLGGDSIPYSIFLYPTNFENKEIMLDYLDKYNIRFDNEDDEIYYTDLAATIADMTGGIIDGIAIVLIAFAAISLFVSLIMISIITYTSVLERTKEIGILKALGARKKDITRVFDAETFIIGIFSGILGVVIAWLLTFPINIILENLTGLVGVSALKFMHVFVLVALSTLLTVLGGHIPARIASKKEAVEALRSE